MESYSSWICLWNWSKEENNGFKKENMYHPLEMSSYFLFGILHIILAKFHTNFEIHKQMDREEKIWLICGRIHKVIHT